MNAFEKWSIWVTSLLTAVTGIGYAWTKYLVEPANAWDAVNHPLQPWLLKAHILVAPLLVFAVGLVTMRHIWLHYRLGVRKGRRSGITAALALAPMVVTGYLIQAVTHAGWLRALVVAHLVTGGLYLAGLGLHQVFVNRKARDGAGEPGEDEEIPVGAECAFRGECALDGGEGGARRPTPLAPPGARGRNGRRAPSGRPAPAGSASGPDADG